jgi:uncharacterized membrane protein YphA (DoxX/SURF4 family)
MSQRFERWSGAIERWMEISHPLRTDSLALFRILFASYLLVFGLPWAVWTSELPPFLVDAPRGPYRLLDGFPPDAVLRFATLLLCVSSVSLLVGYRTRAAALLTGTLLLTLIGFEFSTGKVDHNRHLMMWLPLVLAPSPWGDRYSLDALRTPRPVPELAGWTVSWWALVVGLFFFSGGVAKIKGGWLWPQIHGVQYYVSKTGTLAADALPGMLWELGDIATVLFEAGFVFAIVTLRGTRIFCALAIVFHVHVLLLMKIDFPETVIGYAAFVEWSRVGLLQRAGDAFERALQPLAARPELVVLAGGALVFWFHASVGSPFSTSTRHPLESRLAYWALPLAFAVWHLTREAARALRWSFGASAGRS